MFLETNHGFTDLPQSRVLQASLPRQGPCNLQPAAAGGRLPLRPPASPLARPGSLSSARCIEKGCVFPAEPGGRGECAYHRRQSLEPNCFNSQQPTRLLLEQARFGLPDSVPDDTRARDRRRLAAERVRFMLEDGA